MKMKPGRYVITILLLLSFSSLFAQDIKDLKPTIQKVMNPTICYASKEHSSFHLPPPEHLSLWKKGSGQRLENNAIFEVTYEGFEGNLPAQNAFQFAVDIWSELLESEVPIRVLAIWTSLEPGSLGGALPASVSANFEGAQKLGIYYPVALAEKMAGLELNGPNEPDIIALFSNTANWHYDTSTAPVGESYDLATVVLHELGHGLGFFHSFSLVEGNSQEAEYGVFQTDTPIIFDTEVENGLGDILLKNFDSPSASLQAQLTNQNTFFNSPKAAANNNNNKPKLYAPSTFAQGSSIGHLDEFTYNGTANALMTPQISPGERIHNPGPITYDMFSDMGWIFTRILHTPLLNTEDDDTDFVVTVKLAPDNISNYSYLPDEVKLTYYVNSLDDENVVTMQETGEPDEFTATIPASGGPSTYAYFISVKDNTNRVINNPGKIFDYDEEDIQFFHFFETGPDNEPPEIVLQQIPFVRIEDDELIIEAIVTDNIGVLSVELEYAVNGVSQTNLLLTADVEDEEFYRVTIDLTPFNLVDGDVITYRLIATDNSSNQNVSILPTDGFFTINVVGLAPVQESYANDFNTVSNDFFGSNFSVSQPSGFENPAIHSDHPYLDGSGPNDESSYIYQLRIPIEIAAENAIMTFDEIALIEPGESGTTFGHAEFWDYVVVEGSTDGGINWEPIADGYDARAHSEWLTRYNSGFDATGFNSTGVGDPTLFKNRTIDLLATYEPGDVVVFRFRLFADQLAHGWGWAIDNLRIQIDETPPIILHDHIDYLSQSDQQIVITFIVEDDPSGVESIALEYKFNEDDIEAIDFPVIENVNQYTFTLNLQTQLSPNDVFYYRIIAIDGAQNEGKFPPAEFIEAPVFIPEASVSTYVNDFNTVSNDFIGNFFSITSATGFPNNAIHSLHPYPVGRGINKTSNFSYMLKKPITINSNNPYLVFDEVAIVEPGQTGITFGNPGFKDYVIVDFSKDGGETWQALLDGWDAAAQNIWHNAFTQLSAGNNAMYRTRFVNMLSTGLVSNAETVLLRFRLFSDEFVNAWGWAIDNLQIQGPITSVDDPSLAERAIQLYPNPADNKVHLKIELPGFTGPLSTQMLDMMGRPIQRLDMELIGGQAEKIIDINTLPAGQYLIKMQSDKLSLSKKLMVIK